MHTSGPWYADGNRLYEDRGEYRGDRVAECPSSVRAAENARLIAVAPTAPHECDDPQCPGAINKRKLDAFPELLEALRETLQALDNLHAEQDSNGRVQLGNRYHPIAEAARAAIQKAKD